MVFQYCHAQNDSVRTLVVKDIIIKGNRHTKSYIIKRELDINEGDTIAIRNLLGRLEKGKEQIENTTLFLEVKVEPVILNVSMVEIVISVREKWYIYPLPEFSLADRSWDEWISKYNASLKRVNYGIRFVHNNLTGRKDELNIKLINGYTRNIGFSYRAPYSNPKLTNGFSVGGGYSQTHEVAYKTSYNSNLVYFNNGEFARSAWNASASYFIRKRIKKSETIGINYSNISIADSIQTNVYNPHYFNQPSSRISFADVYYIFQYNDVNNILYPLRGYTMGFTVLKRGLGFNNGVGADMLSIQAEYDRYWSLGKKWYGSMQLQGKIKLPFDEPYFNQSAMGYGNAYVRGLDYAIIDGVAYSISKFNLKREILNFRIPTPLTKSKTFHKIPFKIYAKTFTDYGYCYAREGFTTNLSNKFLYSGGFGLDILTVYDIQFRFEYSFNQLGQNKLFLHNDRGF
jgi:outer membrane protein assembly factor BamA